MGLESLIEKLEDCEWELNPTMFTYVCEKHFRDIARSYSGPSGTNGTLQKFLA